MKTKFTLLTVLAAALFVDGGGALAGAADPQKQKDSPIIIGKPLVKLAGFLPMIFVDNGSKFICTQANAAHLIIWDVKAGKFSGHLDISKQLNNSYHDQDWDTIGGLTDSLEKSYSRQPISLGTSNDGKTLYMTAGPDPNRNMKASWNLQTGEELHTENVALINRWALSPDEKTMAIGIRNGTVFFRNTRTGKIASKMKAHRDRVWGLAYSSDGKYLATASRDGTTKIWRMSDKEELVHIQYPGPDYGVIFSPDSSFLAIASDNKKGSFIQIYKLPPLK